MARTEGSGFWDNASSPENFLLNLKSDSKKAPTVICVTANV